MIERPEGELKIVRVRDPLPTVEVDLDGVSEEIDNYDDFVANALTGIASRSPTMRATIYVYEGSSINFHRQTWSLFFCVAGEKSLLRDLLDSFKRSGVENVRFSDQISPSMAQERFHIQDGYVWRPLEQGTWYADSQDETKAGEVSVSQSDDSKRGADQDESRSSSPSRFRVARADATIGAIRKTIEEVFGLPEGSVVLCGPDNRALRSDATIATLRKRWD